MAPEPALLPKRHPAEVDRFIKRYTTLQNHEDRMNALNTQCDPHFISTRLDEFGPEMSNYFFELVGSYLLKEFEEHPVEDQLTFCARYTNIALYLDHAYLSDRTYERAVAHPVYTHISPESLGAYTDIEVVRKTYWTEVADAAFNQLNNHQQRQESPERIISVYVTIDSETDECTTRTISTKDTRSSHSETYMVNPFENEIPPEFDDPKKLQTMLTDLILLRNGLSDVALNYKEAGLPDGITMPADDEIQQAIAVERKIISRQTQSKVDSLISKLPSQVTNETEYIGPWTKRHLTSLLTPSTTVLDVSRTLTRVDYASEYANQINTALQFTIEEPDTPNKKRITWENHTLWLYMDKSDTQIIDNIATKWAKDAEQFLSSSGSRFLTAEFVSMKEALTFAKDMSVPETYTQSFEYDTQIAIREYMARLVPSLREVFNDITSLFPEEQRPKEYQELYRLINEFTLHCASNAEYITVFPEASIVELQPSGFIKPEYSVFNVEIYQKLSRQIQEIITTLRINQTTLQEQTLFYNLAPFTQYPTSDLLTHFHTQLTGATQQLSAWTTPHAVSFVAKMTDDGLDTHQSIEASLVPQVGLDFSINKQTVYTTVSLKANSVQSSVKKFDDNYLYAEELFTDISDALSAYGFDLGQEAAAQPVSFARCTVGNETYIVPVTIFPNISNGVSGGGSGGGGIGGGGIGVRTTLHQMWQPA